MNAIHETHETYETFEIRETYVTRAIGRRRMQSRISPSIRHSQVSKPRQPVVLVRVYIASPQADTDQTMETCHRPAHCWKRTTVPGNRSPRCS